ncbi:MAG: type II toxin-antitoxin system prevent-host-death family antitoxin [Candidatus Eremiobacteraeota bacterium]|nr:type II toxin-antitoxin system prevent-host-death family antitoxin [Candidatus Eremiobacteraeota bacterium]MBV9056407.1 type II toxin-antitoxin system prevent-host-death family antitoxin [Candidatus Eremiobacteraeota bacterium]MBV9700794.1 type II toxin-antitoxin system prevent-host-death family antitoxin [Candidatus Eremiobacteraeota bacterium]
MKSVGSYEAKTHLTRLLREVESGETVLITRNGSPIAQLSPIWRGAASNRSGAMRRILASTATLGRLTISSLRDEGRHR